MSSNSKCSKDVKSALGASASQRILSRWATPFRWHCPCPIVSCVSERLIGCRPAVPWPGIAHHQPVATAVSTSWSSACLWSSKARQAACLAPPRLSAAQLICGSLSADQLVLSIRQHAAAASGSLHPPSPVQGLLPSPGMANPGASGFDSRCLMAIISSETTFLAVISKRKETRSKWRMRCQIRWKFTASHLYLSTDNLCDF